MWWTADFPAAIAAPAPDIPPEPQFPGEPPAPRRNADRPAWRPGRRDTGDGSERALIDAELQPLFDATNW